MIVAERQKSLGGVGSKQNVRHILILGAGGVSAGLRFGEISLGGVAESYTEQDGEEDTEWVDDGPVQVKLGLGLNTGAGVKDNSLQAKLLGCGLSLRQKVGISLFDNEISIDFGKIGEQLFGGGEQSDARQPQQHPPPSPMGEASMSTRVERRIVEAERRRDDQQRQRQLQMD